MLKRSLIVISLTILLVVGIDPIRTAHGIVMSSAEIEMLNSAPSPDLSGEKNGNAFVRALKAPFRAIGRLFGVGKKDDKLHRLSEKDTRKFESAGVVRVVDARVAPPTAATPADTGETIPAQPESQPANANATNYANANAALAPQHLALGRTLLDSGQINEAIAELSLATSLDPKLSEAHNLLGVAYETKGMRELALRSFSVALRDEHDNAEHLNNMGYLLFKNGDYDQAVKYLKRAVKLAPDQQRFWNNLGLVQAQRAKFDDAYQCFLRAVGEFEGHMNVANRSQAMGYDKDAIKHLEAARAIQPNVAVIHLRLATLYSRTGKTEQALEARRSLATLQSLANVTTTPQ